MRRMRRQDENSLRGESAHCDKKNFGMPWIAELSAANIPHRGKLIRCAAPEAIKAGAETLEAAFINAIQKS